MLQNPNTRPSAAGSRVGNITVRWRATTGNSARCGLTSGAEEGTIASPPAAVIPRCHRDALRAHGARSAPGKALPVQYGSAGISPEQHSHCPGQEGKLRAAQPPAVQSSQKLQPDLQISHWVEGHKDSVHRALHELQVLDTKSYANPGSVFQRLDQASSLLTSKGISSTETISITCSGAGDWQNSYFSAIKMNGTVCHCIVSCP